MWHNIPGELRERAQWCVCGSDKVPLTPRTGQAASSTDPQTWGTYDEAVRSGRKFIGYMLAAWDPYFIIDLDNKPENPCPPEDWQLHQEILEHFSTYTERSASGTGYHIIGRGKLEHSGIKTRHVELYSQARFMVCTGDVVRQSPIQPLQPLLLKLANMLRPEGESYRTELVEMDSPLEDMDVVEMALNASNGDKFNSLSNGQWEGMVDELGGRMYPSQSEADYALLAMLCFYSRSNAQVKRLFRYSALGKRDKAVRDEVYLDYCLSKIRAKEPPPVDMTALMGRADPQPPPQPPTPPQSAPQTAPSAPKHAVPAQSPEAPRVVLPPGLIGEMAQYFYRTTVRPVWEISLGASIALAAGIVGRSYNISHTGLNQYIIIVAGTGTGKEGAHQAIDRLLEDVRAKVPSVRDSFIGPGAFASGQALVRRLDRQRCFLSILGEFGLTIQQMCDPRASSPLVTLRKVLLDLYTKSGWESRLAPSVYSDSEKDTMPVQAPSLTILGETTPHTFFEGLDAGHIAEGLIPRFSIVQYTGPRVERNRNAGCAPDSQLVQKVADLATSALAMETNNRCMPVQTDTGGLAALDEFDRAADWEINSANSETVVQLWNRAHLKALKLSGLVAVGIDPYNPIITADVANWAVNFTRQEVGLMSAKFRTGEVGTGDAKLQAEVRRLVAHYYRSSSAEAEEKYAVEPKYHAARVIPQSYLSRRAVGLASFRRDPRSATNALKIAIQGLLDNGELVELPPNQLVSVFGSKNRAFGLGPGWRG